MNKKKRIVIIVIVLLLVLCISAAVIGILSSDPKVPAEPKEPEIPKITEEFKGVELVSKYTTIGSIYYDNDTKEISDLVKGELYTIGNNGKLFDEKILKQDENDDKDYPNAKSKNFEFYYGDNDYCYYVNTKTKKKSKDYNDIILPFNKELTGIYAILETYDEKADTYTYEVLNTNDGSVTKLDIGSSTIDDDFSIAYREMEEPISTSLYYFPITNEIKKSGLIDYKGNIIIDAIYDGISVYNDKYAIVIKDNKFGVVNFKNEIIIPIEYNQIVSIENFLILEKNKKISIADANCKIYIDSKIDASLEDRYPGYDGIYDTIVTSVINNKLYLVTYYNNKTSIYLINSKDIERKISTSTEFIDLYSFNKDSKYIYTFEPNNDKVILTFYDYDLYEYYKTEFNKNKNIDYMYTISPMYQNKNYYKISLYTEVDDQDILYYIDLLNSKVLDEYNALKQYFDNGYNFYISTDNKLKVYKDKELLQEFDDGEYEYLGGYLFSKDSKKIFELTFKKDSTNQ